jgi:hypothetical protein
MVISGVAFRCFYVSVLVKMLCGEIVASRCECPCKSDNNMGPLCRDGLQVISNESKQELICSCICPGKKIVLYPRNSPFSWDLYAVDISRFLTEISNNPHLNCSGVLFTFYGDNSSLPDDMRQALYNIGKPLLSHSLLNFQSERPTKNFIRAPDMLFLRSHGYRDIVSKFAFDQSHNNSTFENKRKQLFWRGSPTGVPYGKWDVERVQMCQLGKSMNWTDFGLTTAFSKGAGAWYASQGLMKGREEESHWSSYRGVIDIDGSVNAWGLYWKLASGGVVFKFDSPWTNFYIEDLVPWENYIPLRKDFSDFIQITSIIMSDAFTPMLKRIAKNAEKIVKAHSYENVMDRIAKELSEIWARKK